MPFAENRGRKLHWELQPSDGNGTPIVLLPGIGSGMALFGTLPRRLARYGHPTLTFDPAGIPPSSPLNGEYTFVQAAADVTTVLDAAGIANCCMVGTSLGGKVALTLAATEPERFDALVLLASAAAPSRRGRAIYRFFETVAQHVPAEHFADIVTPFLFGRTFHDRKPELVRDIARSMTPVAATRELMLAQARALHDFDGRELARQLVCPTLCVAGREDTLTGPDEVRATAELMPNGSYLEIADAGHTLLLESPTLFDEIRTFLG